MKKGIKQLNGPNRVELEGLLNSKESLRFISERLDRSLSTIKREIKKHTRMMVNQKSSNQCIYRRDCQRKKICEHCHTPGLACSRCSLVKCNLVCKDFKRIICSSLKDLPGHICNSCHKVNQCSLSRFVYRAKFAQDQYEQTLHTKTKGFAMPMEEIVRMDRIISPRIKKGQSMHHIFQSSPGQFNCDERTAMRMLNNNVFDAIRGDLPRACMIRKRKKPNANYSYKVEKGCYVNRTFDDYKKFIADHPGVGVVMIDLVIGRIGGKCILTMYVASCGFMLAYLLKDKCADSVCAIFDSLWETLGPDLFRKLFPVILTDRGSEFSNPSKIEFTPDGSRRTYVFYCNPMNSNQKSQIERNHEQVRRVLPKGTSFDNLTQEDMYVMMSHINSYVLQSQQNKTPFDVFNFIFGKALSRKLKIERIPPEDVILRPTLLEKTK